MLAGSKALVTGASKGVGARCGKQGQGRSSQAQRPRRAEFSAATAAASDTKPNPALGSLPPGFT